MLKCGYIRDKLPAKALSSNTCYTLRFLTVPFTYAKVNHHTSVGRVKQLPDK